MGVTHGGDLRAKIYIYIYTWREDTHGRVKYGGRYTLEGTHGREAKYTHGGDPYRRGDVLMEGAVRSIQHT